MIVGRGLLGNSLSGIDNNKYLFYANGISNSVLQQIPRNNFEINEINRIADKNEERIFIYFSTSQVNSKLNFGRAYVQHKLFIEDLVIKRFAKYLIIRTSNLVGHNPWNKHTLFNYLCNSLAANEQIMVNPIVIRNFLDAAHFAALLQNYLNNFEVNKIIEIVNPVSYTMAEIIIEFENYFLKKFMIQSVSEINDFALFELNNQLSISLFVKCNISTNRYIPYLLKKYYPVVPHCEEP